MAFMSNRPQWHRKHSTETKKSNLFSTSNLVIHGVPYFEVGAPIQLNCHQTPWIRDVSGRRDIMGFESLDRQSRKPKLQPRRPYTVTSLFVLDSHLSAMQAMSTPPRLAVRFCRCLFD